MAPSSGRTTMASYMPLSAFQQINVFDRDRTAVAEIGDQNGKPDGGLGGGDREYDQRINLTDDVAKKARERHQVDVDAEQNELDRHQDDDDVLAVEKDAEDAKREQDRGDRQVMAEP